MPEVHVSLRHRMGALDLDVAFTIESGWTVLFAPSGTGKSTILRMIAGLMRPDHGQVIAARDATLLDTAQGIDVAAHRRGIRMVAQRPALFPHLNVRRNILYGAASEAPENTAAVLALCRVEHLQEKRPSQLSGGERQRVALARAIASGGSMLLLDEPFTGLETSLRDEILHHLRQWTRERAMPVLLVTHDVGEVFATEAQVLKMEAGRIVAKGSPAEVLTEERARLLERLR